ncbi:hypothetical protein DD238_004354 [Peronospora effusa]|uniref:Thioredoxin domain-containing protein n=1 Tax=Peronospora effusa TaxID=542832 RepID=A0A3M6VKB7_9STRA|nr:hypothetical protein DD238_004354 [Peronospora effusa]
MALPRYGRDRQRLRRHGALRLRRFKPLHLLAGGFFVVYVGFLASWHFFGDFSSLESFKLEKSLKRHLAPTEQLSKLRKASNSMHITSDDAIDVKIAERIEEPRGIMERERPKVVLPTTSPLSAVPVATNVDVTVMEKPNEVKKVVVNNELEGHGSGMPMQTVDEMTRMQEELQTTEMKAVVEPSVVVSAEKVAIETVPEQIAATLTVDPFAGRHQEISGYEATMKFLENYQYNPNESLFLFFVCSDEQFKASDWSEVCTEGKKHVYDVFSKSPERNRLVTVFAGSEKYWKYQNEFYNDPDLHVKGVPCIMKWEGHSGRTEGMLVKRSLYDEPFLRYLFKNMDQPEVLFVPEDIKNKQIVTVKGYDSYVDFMGKYEYEENPVPTFLMMVAGRFQNNNRPWCPYCRYSELPLEYAFYSYAPKNARMIRVEVADTYSEWKKRNEFTRDENLRLNLVPLMFYIQTIPAATANDTKSIIFTSHMIRYDELDPLREFFTSFA